MQAVEWFAAVDDAGTIVRLVVYQSFIETRPLVGPASRVPGLKEIRTEDGDPVNFNPTDGSFTDLRRGRRLVRMPAARSETT